MTAQVLPDSRTRRSFIGGSDARIIMGDDEAALVRLWQEKRGEVEPEDLSGDLLVQLGTVTEHLNRHWYEKNTGHAVTDVQRQVFHNIHRWMAATLDGRVEATGAVFEDAVEFLGRNGSRKTYGPAAAQHMGDCLANGGAVDHNRRRKVGGDHHSSRPALPASTPDRGKEVLALCRKR